jgi:hypothetical protein
MKCVARMWVGESSQFWKAQARLDKRCSTRNQGSKDISVCLTSISHQLMTSLSRVMNSFRFLPILKTLIFSSVAV